MAVLASGFGRLCNNARGVAQIAFTSATNRAARVAALGQRHAALDVEPRLAARGQRREERFE